MAVGAVATAVLAVDTGDMAVEGRGQGPEVKRKGLFQHQEGQLEAFGWISRRCSWTHMSNLSLALTVKRDLKHKRPQSDDATKPA